MNTPDLHANAAERLSELLECAEARRHLTAYGWVQGMPVVFSHPSELAEDTMGLVSVHGRAVLLALHDRQASDLELWHVTVPSPIFTNVQPLAAATTMAELCVRRSESSLVPFRVAFWKHSAAIHQIPLRPLVEQHRLRVPQAPRIS